MISIEPTQGRLLPTQKRHRLTKDACFPLKAALDRTPKTQNLKNALNSQVTQQLSRQVGDC